MEPPEGRSSCDNATADVRADQHMSTGAPETGLHPCTAGSLEGNTRMHAPTGCAVAIDTSNCQIQAGPVTAGLHISWVASMQGSIQRASWRQDRATTTLATWGRRQNCEEPCHTGRSSRTRLPCPVPAVTGNTLPSRRRGSRSSQSIFGGARLTLVSPARPPPPHRTPTAAPRAAHRVRSVHLTRESGRSASCPRQAWPCWQSGTCLHVASPARKLTLQLHS